MITVCDFCQCTACGLDVFGQQTAWMNGFQFKSHNRGRGWGDGGTWTQAFHQIIGAGIMLLSKHFCLRSFFPKRFSFYTVCIVQWLLGLASWQTLKENVLNFRSADRWKMHFSWSFRGILMFHGEFWRKFD